AVGRGRRPGRDDGHLGADQRGEQRRFADVRGPDDGGVSRAVGHGYGVQRSVTRGVTGPRPSARSARSATRPPTGTMTGTVAVHAPSSLVGRGSAPIASARAAWLAAAVGSRRLARRAGRRPACTGPG